MEVFLYSENKHFLYFVAYPSIISKQIIIFVKEDNYAERFFYKFNFMENMKEFNSTELVVCP